MHASAPGSVRSEAPGSSSSLAVTSQRSQEEGCPTFPLLGLPKDMLHMVVRALDAGGGERLEDGGGVTQTQQRPGGNPLMPLRTFCRELRDVVDAQISWLTLDIKAEGDNPSLELARLEQQVHGMLLHWPRLEQLGLCMEDSTGSPTNMAVVSAAAAACPDLPRLALLPSRTRDWRLVPLHVRSLRPFRRLRSLTVWSEGRQYSLGLGTGIALAEALPLLEELVLLEGALRPPRHTLRCHASFDCFSGKSHSGCVFIHEEQQRGNSISARLRDHSPFFDLARLHTATNLQRLRVARHDIGVLCPPTSLRALELCSVKLLRDLPLFECPSLTKLELRSVVPAFGPRCLCTLINQLATQKQLTSLALEDVAFDVSTLSRASRGLQSLELISISSPEWCRTTRLPAIPSEHLTRLVISASRRGEKDPKWWEAETDVFNFHGRGGVKELRYLHLELTRQCAWQLKGLSALYGLEHLFIRDSRLPHMLAQKSLPSIPSLPFLKRLVLLECGSLDIQETVRLPSLTSLFLSRSHFMRLSGVMFPKLESLMIKELCGKESIHEISEVPKLRQLGVNSCFDGGELHLKDLPKLESLHLGNLRPSRVVLSCVPLLDKSNLHDIDIVKL